MPKPKEDQEKEGFTMEDMTSEESLKAADEAVKDDVREMLDVLIDEEEDKDKKEDKEEDKEDSEKEESEDEEEEDEKDDKKGEDEEESEDEEEDKEESKEEEEEEDKDKKKDEEPKVDVEVVAKIAKLEGRIEELSKTARAKEEDEEEEKPKVKPIKFISEDRDLAEDPLSAKEYNELLNQARMSAYEEAIKSTPELVGTLVDRKVTLDEAVKTFYEENEDFAPIKDYVGSVANMVVSENPDWKITKVLEETEKRVRKNLDLEKKAEDTHKKTKKKDDGEESGDEEEEKDDKTKKSPLATRRGSRTSRKDEDTRSESQRDIDDIVGVGA